MNTQNTTTTSTDTQVKLKKLVTSSCRPMKSIGRTKSLKPLKIKSSRLRTKVAE